MQYNKYFLSCVVWLVLICVAAVCPSFENQPKFWHDRLKQIHQKTHSTKKLCGPTFSNQTAGAVTQKCSSGFYRAVTGHHRGQCVPCSCNNLSNECDEHTGNCVNCQFNTTGDHCERCKEGYYGNAANRTCHVCPCPFTWNNFALACLDVGLGEVECLCKRGYSGVRCERCTHGYYGNPMIPGGSCKACNCKTGALNVCDSLTGECITSGNSSCGSHCSECDSCTYASLVDLEKLDDGLVWLKQQLKNISHGSPFRQNKLEANTFKTKILVGRYSTAVRHLDPKVEQLVTDVHVIRNDVSQLTDETHQTVSDVEKVSQNANNTQMKAGALLSEAKPLLTATQDLIKQLSEVQPRGSVVYAEHNKMMEEAWSIVPEMRGRSCSAQGGYAASEQEEAQKLLDLIKNQTTVIQETNQASDSLRVSDSSLNEVAKLLSVSEDIVNRTKGLNLKSHDTLHQLKHLQTQLNKEQSMLLPVTEMTKDFLQNVSDIFLVLEEKKNDFENLAAQVDGAKQELFKKLNKLIQIMAKVDMVTKAEEHANEPNRVATELQQLLPHSSSAIDLLSVMTIGAHNSLINALEKAEIAANKSIVAADEALKDVEEGCLVHRTKVLRDNLMQLQTEASETNNNLKTLSRAVNTYKDHKNNQKEKRGSLIMGISAMREDLKHIQRDDADFLILAAKTAASGSNSTISAITERLRNISQEVERLSLTNVNTDDLLIDAEQTLNNLIESLPVLKSKLIKAEGLSRKVPLSANVTESIRRIKDVIEETRHFVNRLSIPTSFNGKSHVELLPPKNLEDIKAFTAVDLLLNRHQNHPSKAERTRRGRQTKHRDANLFVFYLGNKDTSGDYIGMAIRNNMLICVYKLGGVIHEVENGQITTTTNVNSSDFDRVVFHRVYQDAEVNVTQSFTSQKPVTLTYRNLPNTMAGVLDLHADSVVFYVGGYPDDFTPPAELRYPRYRGAIKLSYINDNPVCLFNYKEAANMDTRQPYIRIPHSEVSNYYDGTGYLMAIVKEPEKKKRRLFKFHTNSRETNALLFYIGNEESFFCVFVERGFLVLEGQHAGQELRAQSAEKISLFDKVFSIRVANQFIVQYGGEQVFTANTQPTNYTSYFIGGLPAELRRRHNMTVPSLRGCVAHLTADGESVEYNRTIGVSHGCPASLLGVRTATLFSALSDDSLFAWDELPVRVSLGFKTMDRHSAILRSSSQGSTPVYDLQLSLADGYVVLNSDNYTLKSDKRYNDGSWHYVSAERRPAGLKLCVDNVILGQTLRVIPVDKNSQGEKFKGCIANLYARRPEQSIIPTDLSLLLETGNIVPSLCSPHLPPHTELLPVPVLIKPQRHKPAPAASQCRGGRAHSHEHHLYEEHSWLSYTLPQEDLNYRPHFSFDLKTKSSKGLIFHIAGRGRVPLLALYIANGKIKMSLGENRIIQFKQRSNDDNWHRVEYSVEKSTFHLLVDGIRVTDGQLPNDEGSSLDLHNPVYLGSDIHSKTTKGHDIPMNSVIGCIRNFKMNEVPVEEPDRRHKTLPCFEWRTGVGTFFGGGHLVLDNYFTVGSNFVLAFELRPQHLTGLLFHVQSDKTSLDVFLMENMVGVEVNDGNGPISVSVTPHQSLCDSRFHAVTVSKQGKVIKLVVDSMSEQKARLSESISESTTLHSLFIGGTTVYKRVPVSFPFVGCLRKVKINGRPVALETESRVVEPVSINRCPT
ncbi:laminin subunit alpha-3 isoform X2 [Channa argus]|uniref:laminin subunit alpha-3 isoform X2 n=1 Tax=Channa argus TaxID=215402 RepID=UPI003521CB29